MRTRSARGETVSCAGSTHRQDDHFLRRWILSSVEVECAVADDEEVMAHVWEFCLQNGVG